MTAAASADVPVHVYPTYGREHDTEGGACWCSPERRPVPRDDGTVGWVVVHAEDN